MKSMFGLCFNWKVLVALGAVGVGLLVFAPGYAVPALPLLILAACPVSMILMMVFGMKGLSHSGEPDGERPAKTPEAMRQQLTSLRAEESRLEREIREAQARGGDDEQPTRTARLPR